MIESCFAFSPTKKFPENPECKVSGVSLLIMQKYEKLEKIGEGILF